MNYKNAFFIVTLFIALPLTIHGMNCALTCSKKKNFSPNLLAKRLFFCNTENIDNLRTKISTPEFTISETKNIISKLPVNETNECKKNKLIEYIVFKATEYRFNELQYATVLNQLRNYGWAKGQCCINVMLHSAVISDLPKVTEELLEHDEKWVHITDLHGCVPIDYSQSSNITHMLKNYGSRDAQPYVGEDKWYRVPNYGWQQVTPLRKAVYEGNVQQCDEIAKTIDIEGYMEINILKEIANLRYWRTRDSKYLWIVLSIINAQIDYFESKNK